MQLVRPGPEHLSGYVAALERGWSADNERGEEATREELARIEADAVAFLDSMEDREGKGPPVTLPDGSVARHLPSFKRWLWDGEFCGSIGFRWQPGTTELPPHCLGHIGYAVVPWKQGAGLRKVCSPPDARRSQSHWSAIRRNYDRPGQHRVPTRHCR
jgi:predicted acetyltransferase